MTYKNSPMHKENFVCEVCKYNSVHLGDYKKHLLTKRHEKLTNTYQSGNNSPKKVGNTCECGREYKHRQSLYNHRKVCKFKVEDVDYKEMLMMLIKENKELRLQMGELIPKVGNNNNMNSNNNVKQKFNINVFLNEDCKDALTMNEFIDKIKITLR